MRFHKFIPTILMFIGSVLLLNTLLLFFVSNFNFGMILTFTFGAVFLLWGRYYSILSKQFSKGFLRFIKYVFTFSFVGLLIFCLFLFFYGKVDQINYREDALVILGAAIHGEKLSLPLKNRLDRGVSYLKENPKALVVVSGGQGPQEDMTEAEAMKRYLIAEGIKEEQIIKEEEAKSTYENFLYAKKKLDEILPPEYTIAFVTNDYHVFRASRLAKIVGLTPNNLHAPTMWYTVPISYIRECAAIIKMLILRR